MKATLEFNLDDHDDRINHELAINAQKMQIFIFDILNNLRKKSEAEVERDPDSEYDIIGCVIDEINKMFEDSRLDRNLFD